MLIWDNAHKNIGLIPVNNLANAAYEMFEQFIAIWIIRNYTLTCDKRANILFDNFIKFKICFIFQLLHNYIASYWR